MDREKLLEKYQQAMNAAEEARIHGCWEAAAFHERWAEDLWEELSK